MSQKRFIGLPNVPLHYSIPILLVCISALIILVFIFNVEYPVLLFAPPSNAINVSSCGVLNQNNAYYVLNQSIFSSAGCISITGQNITFDGRSSYWVIGNGINGASGVYVTGKNNTVTGINISSFFNGIHFVSSINSTARGNFVNNSNILLSSSEGAIIEDNLLERSLLFLEDCFNSQILRNYLANANYHALQIVTTNENNKKTTLDNNIFINTSSSYYDLYVYNADGSQNLNSLHLINSKVSRYSLSNSLFSFNNSLNGMIVFATPINSSGNNLSNNIDVGFNRAYFDSSQAFGLNTSATITLFGLPTNLINPVILRDGFICPISVCKNLTSLNAGTVIFNVTGGGNYTISNVSYSSGQALSIDEPGSEEIYVITDFPVNFMVSLISNGSVWFSLNNGSSNTTMSTTNNLTFNYSQSSLAVGNYTFIAYANFTNGTKISSRLNFSVVLYSNTQTMTINEPDTNDSYSYGSSFPVTFDVRLNDYGAVKFSLNSGSTNVTMNTTNSRDFTYEQPQLALGNYLFTAYANFTNGTRITRYVNFSVRNTAGSAVGGSNSGSSSSGSSGSSTGGTSGSNYTPSTFNLPNTSSTNTGNTFSTTTSGASSKSTIKGIVYWLIVAVLAVMIVILILLIVKSFNARKTELNTSVIVSNLR